MTSDLYLFAVDYLKEKGFQQYEISNFAKKGFESKHNQKYWTLQDYLGIGPGAHSFVDGKRFYYDRSIEDFKNDKIYQDGIGGTNEEYVMLKMRLIEGISLEEYKKVFGSNAVKDFERKIAKYINCGYIDNSADKVAFTPKGMLISNAILGDLLFD